MTSLTEFLFPAPAERKASAIIRWWERRRLGYNLIVGGAGVVSVAIGNVLGLLPPGSELLGVPWGPLLMIGGLANVCYLLGPTVELAIEKLSGGSVAASGPVLYRMGLTFSVGLMFVPAVMNLIYWVARIVMTIW